MQFVTEQVCAHLTELELAQAIRAIHQAHLQLSALTANVDCAPYDNAPALKALADCLRVAGHPGFTAV